MIFQVLFLQPKGNTTTLDFIDAEYLTDKYNYILFEYTTDWPTTIASLKSNNIEYTIKKDS